MNLYFSDTFDTDATGSLPAWFTVNQGTWSAQADINAPSPTNDLQNTSHVANDFVALMGGGGVSVPATADMTLTYDIVVETGIADQLDPCIRASAAFIANTSTGSAYTWQFTGTIGGTFNIQLFAFISGGISPVGSSVNTGIAVTAGTKYHVKVSSIGTTHSFKIWSFGSSEPGTAQAVETDGSITGAGYVGFFKGSAQGGQPVDNMQVFGNSSLAAGAITASNITPTTLTLTAVSATGGTGPYTQQWYRSTATGFVPNTANLLSGATSLTLNDTGLTANTMFCYRLVTTDSAGAIVWSPEFDVTITTVAANGAGKSVSAQRTKPLDIVSSGAWMAASLYPVSSAYNGPLFNARRASDNNQQDFFAANNDFPYAAFAAWRGSSAAFLTKLYDQTNTGQGNPAQATAANQPSIVINGAGQAEIALVGPASASLFVGLTSIAIPQNITHILRERSLVPAFQGNYTPTVNIGGTSDNVIMDIWINNGQTVVSQFCNATGANLGGPGYAQTNVMSFHAVAVTIDDIGGLITMYDNGTSQTSATYAALPGAPSAPQRNGAGLGYIGLGYNSSTSPVNFTYTHFIAYSRALSATEVKAVSAAMQTGAPTTFALAQTALGGRTKGSGLVAAPLAPSNVFGRGAAHGKGQGATSSLAIALARGFGALKGRGAAIADLGIAGRGLGRGSGRLATVVTNFIAGFGRNKGSGRGSPTSAIVVAGRGATHSSGQGTLSSPQGAFALVRIIPGWGDGRPLAKKPFANASGETSEPFSFDFMYDLAPGDSLATINSFTCIVYKGSVNPDPNAANIVLSLPAPWIDGTKVNAICYNWVNGVQYILKAVVTTTNGARLQLSQFVLGSDPT